MMSGSRRRRRWGLRFEGCCYLLPGIVFFALPFAGLAGISYLMSQNSPTYRVIVFVIFMVLWRYLIWPFAMMLVFEGLKSFDRARVLGLEDISGLVLYLRPFDQDGGSSHPLWSSFRVSRREKWSEEGRDGETEAERHQRAMKYVMRSFGATALALKINKVKSAVWGFSYEQELKFATSRIGPLISLGDLKEIEPGLEAIRLYASRDQWVERITALIKKAKLIIIRPGKSDGIRLEMGLVRQLSEYRRVLLYFPVDQIGLAEDDYSRIKPAIERGLSCTLPGELGGAIVLGFDDRWMAHAFDRGRKFLPVFPPDVGANAMALSVALRRLGLPARAGPPLGLLVIGMMRLIWLICLVVIVIGSLAYLFRWIMAIF
jgi:hypothetical protein